MSKVINEIDIANINAAIEAGGDVWSNVLLSDVKRKIKNYNRYIQSQQCCYCRRSFADEFNMVIDIEHVLPKGQFREYMFEMFNLSVSCKRCNMEIKRERTDFIVDMEAINDNPKDNKLYKLIHPNLDEYSKHIEYHVNTKDTNTLVKYQIIDGSKKGEFTYVFFELSNIERESMNQAQGIKITEKLSDKIDPLIAAQIRDLLRRRNNQ